VGVGYDKRVDCKNKASSDRSVNVFWDASGREMVERSETFNPQTASRKNRVKQSHCATHTKRNFEGIVCSNGF